MYDPDDRPDDVEDELPEHEDELPADALAQLVATFGQDEETRRLLQQFPTDDPGVPWDMSTNKSTDIDKDIAYDNRPELRTIALDKRKYRTQRRAEIRIREICLMRGERIHQMFETALHWVARVYAWRVP